MAGTLKIAVIDTCTVTKGDLDLSALDALGAVTYYDLLDADALAAAAAESDAVICNKARFTREVLEGSGRLRYIGLFATGYDNIDLAAADERGITVCNVPGYSTDAVAQHTFALILQCASSVAAYDASVHRGDWCKSKKFSYFSDPIQELRGKTLSIVGYGSIGKAVARIGAAFGMRVLVYTRTPCSGEDVCFVPFEQALREADFLSLHCPLNDSSRGLIDAAALSLMKRSAYLINTARGAIVEEQALADALAAGGIAGAGIDVLSEEPMRPDHPYLTAPGCILTPHIAWAALEARVRLIAAVAENLRAFLSGAPIHVVNHPRRA